MFAKTNDDDRSEILPLLSGLKWMDRQVYVDVGQNNWFMKKNL